MGYKIMKFDGADLFHWDETGNKVVKTDVTSYSLDKDGNRETYYSKKKDRQVEKRNSKLFNSRIEDSMDLEVLEDIISKHHLKNQSYFTVGRQPATHQVIQLTFQYSVKQPHTIKQGENSGTVTTKTVKGWNTLDIRKRFYNEGFDLDGIHYVRWKRSGGSARTGKCYFVNEIFEQELNEFSDCGVDRTKPQDLASNEAYRALPLSSKIDNIEIRPENILVIDDCTSSFEEKVMLTTLKEVKDKKGKTVKRLTTDVATHKIKNKIHDGQSLIDKSLMPEKYQSKGMLLLRHIYFKSCCFNSNIQDWFRDNGITDISQLNGLTVAKDIKDIKIITTPSSIKYIKFGDKENWLTEWLQAIEKTKKDFGIVKYEKPTKYFDGDMVRTHYQILNSIQLEIEEVQKLAVYSIEYLHRLRTDYIAMLTYCMEHEDDEDTDLRLNVNADIICRLMKNNKDFKDTEYYATLAKNIIEQLRSDIKIGRILVKGNYSTLLGNPIEMLQASIGKWNGESQVGVGNIVSTAFPEKKLLAARAPHICSGNVYLPMNTKNELVERYINLTPNIVVINSIGENTLQRLSGADMDSDVFLLTDNEILIKGAEKHYDKMLVPTTDIEAQKKKLEYTPDNLAELDHNTAKNLIGQIVNLSQILNSIYWDTLNGWQTETDEEADRKKKKLDRIYKDICQLSVMSGIEIDKAKKDYSFLNIQKELNTIRDKYKVTIMKDGQPLINKHGNEVKKLIYPKFFKELSRKGKFKTHRYYKSYQTTVDYLEEEIRGKNFIIENCNMKPLSQMWEKDKTKTRDIDHEKIEAIKKIVKERTQADSRLAVVREQQGEEEFRKQRYEVIRDFRDAMEDYKNLDRATLNRILETIEETENRYLLQALLDIQCKNLMRILKSNPTQIYVRDENGNIEIYGFKFKLDTAA